MRLGLHVHTRGRNDLVRRYIDEVRPPVMKWLVDGADPELMRYARSLGVKVVLRRVADPLSPGATGGRILERQVLTMADQYRGCFDYVEAANEELQGRDDPKQLDKLAELMLDFMQVCDARGHKACTFNFSVGQPELERWTRPAMLACLDYAAVHDHAIGAHEYYKPVPWQGTAGWTAGGSAAADGWWMLRIVKALAILRARGRPLPAFIITESGRDDVSGTPGGGKGWRDDRSGHDYAEYMSQYCRHLRHHPEILGVVDFGFASTAGGDPRWHSFDLAAEPATFDRMIAKMKEIPMGKPNIAPAPVPAPAPLPADPFMAALAAAGGPAAVDARASVPRHASSSYSRVPTEGLVGIAVHHSASPRDTTAEAIARFHVDTRGWAGIGYHILIRRGVIHYVGDLGTARAHVAGRNHELVGICVTGDYSSEEPAAEDVAALRRVVAALDVRLGRQLRVAGHGEWAQAGHGTQCPGRLAGVIAGLRGGSGSPSGSQPGVPGVDLAALWQEAAVNQVIRLNPAAALQRAILAAGMVPTSGEWDHGSRYVAQRGESLAGGAVEVFVYDKQTGAVQRHKRAA